LKIKLNEPCDTDEGVKPFGELSADAQAEIQDEEDREVESMVTAVIDGNRDFDKMTLEVKIRTLLKELDDIIYYHEPEAEIYTDTTLSILQTARDQLLAYSEVLDAVVPGEGPLAGA
jgi:hypothetical protein